RAHWTDGSLRGRRPAGCDRPRRADGGDHTRAPDGRVAGKLRTPPGAGKGLGRRAATPGRPRPVGPGRPELDSQVASISLWEKLRSLRAHRATGARAGDPRAVRAGHQFARPCGRYGDASAAPLLSWRRASSPASV